MTINCVVSVRLHGRNRLPLDGFSRNGFFCRICRTNSNFAKIELNVTDMKTYMHVYKYKEYGRDRKAEETVDDVKRNVAPKCYVTRTSRTRYLTSTNQNRYRWANLLGVMKRPSVAAELQHYLDSRANYLHKHIWACLCRKMCRVAACCCPAPPSEYVEGL
jgi:hypothetical protein